MRRQVILARAICHYDATIAGLEGLNVLARAEQVENGGHTVVVVPLLTLSKLRLQQRILLDRWDFEYPGSIQRVGVFDARDLAMRAGLVRAWLTLRTSEGGDDT